MSTERRFARLLILAGVILQAANWLYNRSLWNDELAMALNVQNRGFVELARPLDYAQAAPIGFLWIEKLLTASFGQDERIWRLFPLAMGMGSLTLAWAYFRRLLESRTALIALALMVFQPRLIEYSAELKPYTADTCVALAALWIDVRLRQSNSPGRWLAAFISLGAVGPWISFPFVLVMAATGSSIVFGLAGNRRWRLLVLALVGLICCLIGAAEQLRLLRDVAGDSYLRTFWGPYFMPTNGLFAATKWMIFSWLNLFRDPMKATSAWLAAPLAAIGLVVLVRTQLRSAMVVAGVLALAILAAVMHRYPLGDRLALYLLPIMAVFIVLPLARLIDGRSSVLRAVGVMMLIVLSADSVSRSFGNLVNPKDAEAARPVVEKLAGALQKGDAVYVFLFSRFSFQYYAPRAGIEISPHVGSSIIPAGDASLAKLLSNGRVWIYFAHGSRISDVNYRDRFMQFCRAHAVESKTLQDDGVAATLFEPRAD